MISAGISKAKSVPREEALKKVEKKSKYEEDGRQHRLIVEYDRRSSPALGGILDDNYHQMVARDRRMGRIFPNPPRPTYKRGKNIKELLCRAKLPPIRCVNTRATAEGAKNGLTVGGGLTELPSIP